MLSDSGRVQRRYSDCLTGKSIAYEARKSKPFANMGKSSRLAGFYLPWLRGEMTRKGWSAAELARRAKLNPASVWKILNGQSVPKEETLEQLARALGVPLPAISGQGTPILPERHGLPPGSPAAPGSPVERPLMPAGEVLQQALPSGPVRSPDEQEALWKGFRVVASRIARTVEHTIAGNELGYSPESRRALATALRAFARELDAQSGEVVCGDIWQLIDRLRETQ